MRKQLLAGIAAVSTLGFASAHAEIVPVTFGGVFSTADMNGNIAPGATDPNVGGLNFQITLNYDTDTDDLDGAMIAIDLNGDGVFDDATDMFEFFDATVINAPADTADANAVDVLDIDLASFNGVAAGEHEIRFEFFNTFLETDSLGDAFAALDAAADMSMLICSHFLFNFGGFKYTGELTTGIDFGGGNLDPVPVPGAAVFMLSGLAAAGAAAARRRRAAA